MQTENGGNMFPLWFTRCNAKLPHGYFCTCSPVFYYYHKVIAKMAMQAIFICDIFFD